MVLALLLACGVSAAEFSRPVSEVPVPAPDLSAAAPLVTLNALSDKFRIFPPTSRELARDLTAAKLSDAGYPALLERHGLVLWHVMRTQTRSSGERVTLTMSLPADGRPIERGAADARRREELDRRLAAAEKHLVAEAARVLELPEDMVNVSSRLIESCCGAGCESCLLTKKAHAKEWTGLEPRRPDRR